MQEKLEGENGEVQEFKELDVEVEVTEPKTEFGLEPGTYVFKYIGTKQGDGENGPYLIHKWEEVETGTWVTEISSMKMSPKSKLFDIFRAVGLEPTPGKKVRIGDLMGTKCMMEVIMDGEYLRVKTHVALPKEKGANPPPHMCQDDPEEDDCGWLE